MALKEIKENRNALWGRRNKDLNDNFEYLQGRVNQALTVQVTPFEGPVEEPENSYLVLTDGEGNLYRIQAYSITEGTTLLTDVPTTFLTDTPVTPMEDF